VGDIKYAASYFSNSARREQKCLHRMAQDQLEEAKGD
jgi:hypothetical protein